MKISDRIVEILKEEDERGGEGLSSRELFEALYPGEEAPEWRVGKMAYHLTKAARTLQSEGLFIADLRNPENRKYKIERDVKKVERMAKTGKIRAENGYGALSGGRAYMQDKGLMDKVMKLSDLIVELFTTIVRDHEKLAPRTTPLLISDDKADTDKQDQTGSEPTPESQTQK
jgi:hypothetical protein